MHSESDLERFVEAQDAVYESVRRELRAGRKATHWMWFVFPQLRALGRSTIAQHYGIVSLDEARAYWQHPLLGARLRRCVELLGRLPGSDPVPVLGAVDALKLRSCLTLFERAAPDEPLFGRLLAKYYAGARDAQTLALLDA